MDHEKALLHVTDRLYAAATSPAEWSSALESMVELLRGDHAFLHAEAADNGDGAFLSTARVDKRVVARCVSPECWRLIETHKRMIPIGTAVTRAALMSDEDFVRSDIYNEIVKPQNGFHAVYARRAGPWSSFVLAVNRPPLADAFEPADTATVQSLLPHLTTAVELHQRLQMAERRQLVLARALDQLNAGVILTDAAARPSFVNACAARMVTEFGALKLDDAGLAATTPLATRQLREAILAASADTAIKSRQLRLQQPSHRLPLLLTLVPIFRLDPTVPGVRAPRVAIFIKEPGAVPAIDRDAVGETFRLTRRETDVAILLGGGISLDQIAAKLGLGVGTVRHHLKRTFDKSGAHTQAALVALVRGFDLLGS